MKYFDEAQLLHEKAGYGGWILHGTAGSWLGAVLGGPVRALGRADRSSQDVLSPEIVRGGPVTSSNETPDAGQVSVYDELAEQIKANKDDALFAVKVVLCGVTDEIAEEYHKAYMDALNAPVIQEYNAQYVRNPAGAASQILERTAQARSRAAIRRGLSGADAPIGKAGTQTGAAAAGYKRPAGGECCIRQLCVWLPAGIGTDN